MGASDLCRQEGQEGDVHLLALRGQVTVQRVGRTRGAEDAGLVFLGGRGWGDPGSMMEAGRSSPPVPAGPRSHFCPPHHGPVTHEHPQVPGTRQPHGAILLRAAHNQHCPLLPRQRGQGEGLRHSKAGRLDGGEFWQKDEAMAEGWSACGAGRQTSLRQSVNPASKPSAVCLLCLHLGHTPTSLAQLLQKR